MNATNFFTRRRQGMDFRVWNAMLLVCLLSLGIYSYKQIRISTINHQPCPTDTISVNGKRVEFIASCYLSQYSLFEVPSEAAATVEWDFRDDTPVEKGRVVSHKFMLEGRYRVMATVNGGCKLEVYIEVVEDLLPDYQKKPVIEVYTDPMHPAAGGTVKFYCVTDMPSITSYEWKVIETNEVRNEAEPAFTFNGEGNYTIQLVMNDDPSTKKKKVIVVAGMPQTQETPGNIGSGRGMQGDIGLLKDLVPPGGGTTDTTKNHGTANSPADSLKGDPMSKATEVDANSFRDLLQNVVDQNGKEPEDLYEFLDYKESTRVEVNENKSSTPLKDFCKDMRSRKKKKRKIESLSFKMDDKKSIQVIRVKIPASEGFWGRLNPFN